MHLIAVIADYSGHCERLCYFSRFYHAIVQVVCQALSGEIPQLSGRNDREWSTGNSSKAGMTFPFTIPDMIDPVRLGFGQDERDRRRGGKSHYLL